MTIQEQDKLIAEFMGFTFYPDDTLNGIRGVLRKGDKLSMHLDVNYLFHAEYHTSWIWLMEVVDKIESMDTKLVDCRITIERNECRVFYNTGGMIYNEANSGISKINSVYKAVVHFIQWYVNANPQSTTKE